MWGGLAGMKRPAPSGGKAQAVFSAGLVGAIAGAPNLSREGPRDPS